MEENHEKDADDQKPENSKTKKTSSKPKSCGSKASKTGLERHGMWRYPKRCEVEGCDNMENLMKCSACEMVNYCKSTKCGRCVGRCPI